MNEFIAWAIVALFVLWPFALIVSAYRHTRRFQSWAQRDKELSKRWFAAFDSGDYDEAERLRYNMRKNWEAYREQ